MRADSAVFATYNEAASKRPRVVLELAFDSANTDLLYLTSHADCDLPDNAVSSGIAIQNVVREISGQTQQINPDQANATIGGFAFEAVDKNFAVRNYMEAKLAAGFDLRKKRVRAYVGYKGMLWADYALVLTYIIDGLSCIDGVYKYKCSDIQREVRKNIFKPAVTYLTKSVTANQGRIPCLASSTSFLSTVLHDSSYTVHPSLSVFYIKVENEVVACDGMFTHGTDGICFRVLAEYTGTHNGSGNAATLSDSTAAFPVNGLIGLLIENTTDGSTGTITANTATTVTATLSGGTDNDWDVSDAYKIYTGRGVLNTRAVEHVMDSSASSERRLKIEEYIFIEGPAPKVAYQLLTGIVAQNLFTYSSDFTHAAWTDPGSTWTVTGNTDVAPDGTTTADEITVTGAGNALIRYVPSPTIAGGGTYTASVWAKIKSGTADSIDIDFGDSATPGSTTLTSQWQRIWHSDASHATNNWVDFNIINASAGAKIVLWGAQLSATPALIPYYATTATARSALTLPTNWHLGISTEYVRASDFTDLGPDYWNQFTNTGRHTRFEITKETDGKKFIETELWLFLGAFMPIYSTGELGLKRLAPVLSNSGYSVLLNRSNIVNYSELVHDFNAVINQMYVEWHYVAAKGEYLKKNLLIDETSIATHNDAPLKGIKLRGVHTGSHTDRDIESYFDTMRDRYAGPPLRLDVTVLPSLNKLEVGDTVRLQLDEVRDYTNANGTGLDRVFEVQQVSLDWLTGDVKIKLFGSSMKAGAISRTSASTVLNDAFYNSAGTNLTSVLTISGGAVTANGSLTGGDTMAQGIYYYLGDLTINAGVNINISKNVELRIRGHLTINGTINGKGQGLAGGAGATLWNNGLTTYTGSGYGLKHNAGVAAQGYLGTTQPGSDILLHDTGIKGFGCNYEKFTQSPLVSGNLQSVPFFAVINSSTDLLGVPTDLRGTPGSGGGCVYTWHPTIPVSSSVWTIRAAGGNGGAGGAGLLIVSRGTSFGGAGSIDLSGADGVASTQTYTFGSRIFQGPSGAGGAPGGFALYLDGNHTPPELATELVQLFGDSPVIGTPLQNQNQFYFADINGYGSYAGVVNRLDASTLWYTGIVGFETYDMGDAAYTLQYLPTYSPIEEELPPPPPNVTGLAAVNDGLYAKVTWNALANSGAIKYRIKLGSTWSTATFLADIDGTEYKHLMSTQTTYNFMVAAVDVWGQESQTPASTSVAGVPAVSIGSNVIGADDYLSSTFFYRNKFESIDGINVTNATLNTNGYISLSNNLIIGVTKYIRDAIPALTFTKNWKFKTSFKVASGTGQYIVASTSTGLKFQVWKSAVGAFGIVCISAPASTIQIYAYAYNGSTTTTSLITTIADTGLRVYVEVKFISGTSVQAILTISGVTYTATINTSIPASGAVDGVMYIASSISGGVCTVEVDDWVSVQE